MLARRSDRRSEDLEAVLRSQRAELRRAGLKPRAAVAVEPDPFTGTAHGAEVPARIDGLLSVELSASRTRAELAAVFRKSAEQLAQVADLDRSGLIYGVQRVIFGGDGPLQVSFALRRRATMDHGQFSDYWLNVHGRMAREAPRRKAGGYRQLHADLIGSRDIAAAAGFGVADYDGIVSSDHSGVERMKKAFGHPAVSEIALADERRFIDHARSAIGLLRKLL
ncbi:hypothetical protein BST20_06340 [Mycobacterium branderi]|uniref:EthD domain-containing protein n=1 Tax=Mycobacterium branderi TaxID=43348 RepID=A0AA91LZ08_9MYCO|nr:hypothetical protein BST20_06340 [Mycobacterium branderi]